MDSVRKGKVDWTGDNPFIYLKTDPAGDWSTLALYFRIVASDHGRGFAMLVLERPYEREAGEAVRLCLTDNEPLARYLVEGFVRRFGLFRAAVALDGLRYVGDARFETEADGLAAVTEIARSAGTGLTTSLSWQGLQTPFAVALPPAETQTGEHEMFSVFQPASAGVVTVNGRRIAGETVERDFLDRRAQSAALAHSETWVRSA